MSGRAGRRGMDDRGIVILMVDEKMSPTVGKQLLKVTGRGVGLVRPGACLSEVWAWGGGAAQRAAAHTLLPPYPPPRPEERLVSRGGVVALGRAGSHPALQSGVRGPRTAAPAGAALRPRGRAQPSPSRHSHEWSHARWSFCGWRATPVPPRAGRPRGCVPRASVKGGLAP